MPDCWACGEIRCGCRFCRLHGLCGQCRREIGGRRFKRMRVSAADVALAVSTIDDEPPDPFTLRFYVELREFARAAR